MKISGALITGGGGFLGSHLAEEILSKNKPVVCVDNFCTGLRDNKKYLEEKFSKNQLCFIEADVVNPWEEWLRQIPETIMSQISHVFHFASPASPVYYQKLSLETMWVNSVGLQRALHLADSLRARLIFASTSEVYGDPSVSPQPESYWGNVNTVGFRSCYDESKRFGEALVFTHNLKNQTKHGMVRIFNTYGPRMNPNDGRVIINFLVQALKGEALTVMGQGDQTRSFCYVSDLISGILTYSESQMVNPMNVGNDIEFSINELAQEVIKIFKDQKLNISLVPLPSDDPKQRCPDLSLIKKNFPDWRPRVSLNEGLHQMVTWLKKMDLTRFENPGRPQ
jgi:UDP-glucuronate decarboxylase